MKNRKTLTIIYIIIQIVSITAYLLNLFKHKFGQKGVRRIGDFNVTLTNDKFEGEGGMFSETYHKENNVRDIEVRTDLYFSLMSKEVQNCILAHECGHHLYSKPIVVPVWCAWDTTISSKRDLEDEHMADTYSVDLYGKKATIKMLRWFFIFTMNVEVLQRIKKVKEM